MLAPSLVVGIGEGLVWVSSMVGATSGADPRESSRANTSQQLGGALGIAGLVALATHTTASNGGSLTDGLSAGLLGGAVIAGVAALAAIATLVHRSQGEEPSRSLAAARSMA